MRGRGDNEFLGCWSVVSSCSLPYVEEPNSHLISIRQIIVSCFQKITLFLLPMIKAVNRVH